jgi:hypothetical protein
MDRVKKALTIKVSALRKWAVKYAARLKNWNHVEIALHAFNTRNNDYHTYNLELINSKLVACCIFYNINQTRNNTFKTKFLKRCYY